MTDDQDKKEMTAEEMLAEMQRLAKKLPSKEEFGAAKDKAEKSHQIICGVNSNYPATKEFLEARGLKSVSELDAQGRDELLNHLLAKLALYQQKNNNTPSGEA